MAAPKCVEGWRGGWGDLGGRRRGVVRHGGTSAFTSPIGDLYLTPARPTGTTMMPPWL
ncbi:hypothetical protein [Streptomyces sp. NPDC093514]|uniref:hypothetical protein n=1 Tax=Streptomyces sp. NPDC093514 TaxID=3366039 RepID=UPI00381DF31A